MTEQELYQKAFQPLHASVEVSLKKEVNDTRKRFLPGKMKAACACVAVILGLCNMTCYAAYHIYQTKHLTVFFEKGVSQADIEEIGKKLDSMNAFSGVELQIEYVSADQAWEDFCSEYFDDSFLQKFDDNPLKDSANYQVTVKLFSDTENVRKQIESIPGVRKVTDLKEENKNH